MDSEKKKNNVLFEDLQMGSTNYLGVGKGQGQSAMQLKPGKITLLDLLKQAKDWDEEMHRAPNRLPYPLQDGLSDQLGQLFVDASQVMDKVAQSTKNSIIKDNKQAMKSIKKIHRNKKATLYFGDFALLFKCINSPGGIRTCDQSINSRSLYR